MFDQAMGSWLLDSDAAIRWQVKRDLLDAPPEDVNRERSLVATTGWGKTLLDHQDAEGTWAGAIYSPKWTSTTYTLLLLQRMGLDRDVTGAHRGVAVLWNRAKFHNGGVNAFTSLSYPEACITSMYIKLATYFHYSSPQVDAAVGWLLDNQLVDGGWNCNTPRTGDQHSSFHTTIVTLEALAQVQQTDDSTINDAVNAGQEFFLRHKLFRSHRTGKVAGQAFTKLSFPPRWHYDVLRGLDYFETENAPWDARLEDAVSLLLSKRRTDGAWPVQNKHQGKTWFDMERTGGPSRWNTLRALRVLAWVDTAQDAASA